MEEHTREEFIAAGRKIASQRIIKDEQRIYNAAFQFWHIATPAQKKTLIGFTPELLSLAVAEARKLTEMAGAADAAKQAASGTSAQSLAEAAKVQAAAAALRDQATSTLKTIAAHDRSWLTRIVAAQANADLPTALGALAGVASEMLGHGVHASKRSASAARCKLHGLGPAYIDELRAAEDAARSSQKAHVGRTRTGAQGALDLEDGFNLYFLGAVIRAFDAAHDRDTTIPRLVPISTRRLFGAHSHGARADANAPPPVASAPPAP